MAYTDKLTALKTKVSALTNAVNQLPATDASKPINVGAVNSAISGVEDAVLDLNS